MATHRNTECGVDATGYSNWPQHTASNCNALQLSATHRNIVQHKLRSRRKRAFESVAMHCNTQQHTATHCDLLQHRMGADSKGHLNQPQHKTRQLTATYCNSLQHKMWSRLKRALKSAATQHAATHCNSLQLTATHCNTGCGADSRGHLNQPQHILMGLCLYLISASLGGYS